MNSNIFCDETNENEKANRFASLTRKVIFTNAFLNVGKELSDVRGSIFPILWDYTYSAAGFISTGCFKDAKASNAGEVGDGWK
ncbi:MAG: hypothetical protein ACRCZY_02340 [Phocaeicola sp.]